MREEGTSLIQRKENYSTQYLCNTAANASFPSEGFLAAAAATPLMLVRG